MERDGSVDLPVVTVFHTQKKGGPIKQTTSGQKKHTLKTVNVGCAMKVVKVSLVSRGECNTIKYHMVEWNKMKYRTVQIINKKKLSS